jgi:hypothetical protein
MADKDDLEKTIAEDLVVTKYKMSAEITQSKSKKESASRRIALVSRAIFICGCGSPLLIVHAFNIWSVVNDNDPGGNRSPVILSFFRRV